MKTLLFAFLLLGSLCVKAQQEMKDRELRSKDSLATVLVHDLEIKKDKADSVMSAIYSTANEIRAAFSNKSITRENSMTIAKQAAARRDEQIGRLLTTEQVQKLKAIMAVQKQKSKHEQP